MACGFSGSGDEADPGTDPGTGGNGGGGTTPPRCKFDYVDVCGKTAEPARTFQASVVINTSVDTSCTYALPQGTGNPELCVIHAAAITINQGVTVRAVGSRPLALVSSGEIKVSGVLDVSSHRATSSTDENLGAGAAGASCPEFLSAPDASGAGGGGAAGGSFSGKGGDGGFSDEVGGPAQRAAGRAFNALSAPSFLRGGCRGQNGGDGSAAGSGGLGGPPGGALLLAASGDISIASTGRISAGGGGATGSSQMAGGGGGGSGGMIVLEGKAVHRVGTVIAMGGGGGQGSFLGLAVVPGEAGDDTGNDTNTARGGNNNLYFTGGNGSSTAGRNGQSGDAAYDGAGGGGGAAGFIILRGPVDGSGPMSPPAS